MFDYDDTGDFDFDAMRRSKTVRKPMAQKPQKTTVDATDFADSKPTFAARKKKVAYGTLTNADDFNVARKRVGTMAAKKVAFLDSDSDN